MVEVDVGGVAAADVRMLQRPAVHFLFGDLRQLVDECLHSDPLRNQLTQRFLQKKKNTKKFHFTNSKITKITNCKLN